MSRTSVKDHVRYNVAYLLLISKDGSILDDDEAIFAAEVASNRGTRGRLIFFGRPYETAGPSDGNLAKLARYIGQFNKHASNGFCSFKEKFK